MNRLEQLLKLNQILLSEQPQYQKQAADFPLKLQSQWRLFRSLVNVREPKTGNAANNGDSNSSSSASMYKVKINAIGLRMRSGPGTNYSMKGIVIKGSTYDIVDTKNGWGQIGKNGYWIKLSYTIPVNSEFNVKVTAKDLNMRTGPGILHSKKGYIKPGTHTIKRTDGGWGQLKSNGYWIKLSYTKIV